MNIDMIGGAIDELYERAQAADNKPESDYGDLAPIRWFKFQTGPEKKKSQFGMFLMTYFSETLQRAGLFRTRYQHFKMPVGGNDVITRTCMAKSVPNQGIRCPFCEAVQAEMELTKSKEKRQALAQYNAKGYAYVNVLPTMVLGRRPEYSQYEGDGKMPYLPHVVKVSEKLADKVAQYLRDNNALTDPSLNPLNPMNAAQAFVEVDRVGSRPMDVRYDINFAMGRAPWASDQNGVDFLYQNTYDLAAIFRYATDDEYKQQWEEVEKFKNELLRKRNATSATPTGYDAPSYAAPAAAPVYSPTAAPSFNASGATAAPPAQPMFSAPAPAAAPMTAAAPAPTAYAAPVAPQPLAAPAAPAPVYAPAPAPVAVNANPPMAPSFNPPPQMTAGANPYGTSSPAVSMGTPVAVTTPSNGPATPPPMPSYGLGEQRIAPPAPSAPVVAAPRPIPTLDATVLGGPTGFQQG